jgi:hypothetical protein
MDRHKPPTAPSSTAARSQSLGPPHGGLGRPGQRLVRPVPALANMSGAPVEIRPCVDRDAQPGLGLARLGLTEVLRRLHVGVISDQPDDTGRHLRREPIGGGPSGQLLMPIPVPTPQRGVLPSLKQAFLAELAHRLRQPVPDDAALGMVGDQHRLVGQRGQPADLGHLTAAADEASQLRRQIPYSAPRR